MICVNIKQLNNQKEIRMVINDNLTRDKKFTDQ